MAHANTQFWISISFALIGGVICMIGLLMRVLLYYINKDRSNLLLCIGVMALIWHVFIYCMIYTGEIQYYPRIYNKGIPFYYLVAPCFYFYVRLKVKPHAPMPKYWVLHLIPFFFGLIDVIPYAIAPQEQQKELLRLLVDDVPMGFRHHFGFVDQQLHYILRFSLAICYAIGQWRMLYVTDGIDKNVKRDVLLFNNIYTAYLVLQCSMVVAIVFNTIQEAYILKSLDKLVWVSLCYLMFSIWFVFDTIRKVIVVRKSII